MPHQFVHQPYEGGYDLRDFFSEVAGEDAYNEVAFIVAWVKLSGVDSLRSSIEALRNRGVRLRVVVGISQGGTSRQGLLELTRLVDEAFIFHLPGRTFHPKVYLAAGDARALLLVGSHNLTAGGAARNFEAGTLSRLNLSDPTDLAYVDSVRTYYEDLVADDEICKRADDEFLEALLNDRRYWLSDEDDSSQSEGEPNEEGPHGSAGDRDGQEWGEPALFGTSSKGLRGISYCRSSGRRRSDHGPVENPPAPSEPAQGPIPPPGASGLTTVAVISRWFKQLKHIDAQHPTSAHGHLSNTMTLVADRRHPINTQTYFRDVFFGNEAWAAKASRGRKAREVAVIQCEVIARETSLGMHSFEIRHTPDYNSGQKNRVTELVWGELGPYMRENSHVGDYATLEKLSSGTYRLHLEPYAVGPFLP